MPDTSCVPWSKSRYIGDGHPTFNRNPSNGYINPYYWVDDHPFPSHGMLTSQPHLLDCHRLQLWRKWRSIHGPIASLFPDLNKATGKWNTPGLMMNTFPYHPWDWYIYLLIDHKKSSKSRETCHTSMDGMGLGMCIPIPAINDEKEWLSVNESRELNISNKKNHPLQISRKGPGKIV